MHPGQSLFTGVKIIDYRNARYQGLFNSQTGRRHGLGILIDDDMNLYCAEWEDGKLAGSTFVFFNNGNYIYGTFRSNQANGIAVYRNREFLLLGNYHRGANVGSSLAITDSINHLLVFNGEEVPNKEKKKDVDVVSSQSILEVGLFEDIIAHTAAKHNLQLGKKDASILEFLKALVEKYSQYIQLTQRTGIYYFGFQGGAAMRFTLNGRVNHRMSLVSMGWHDDERVTDFGAKFHDVRCIEQGNFTLKETITYNKSSERPRQKCHSIFQKNHKKALNFLNEYFEYRQPSLANIESFLMSRLLPKHQENLKHQYDMRRLQRLQGLDGKDAHKESREELNKKANLSKNARKGTDSRTPNKSLSKNCSKAQLHKKELTGYSPIPYRKYNERNQESLQVDQYQEIQEELLNFKKEPVCERCRSKQKKRSQNKVGNNPRPKKSLERNNSKSKSTHKLDRPNGGKQIKYLVNYRPQQRERSPLPLQKGSNPKSISSMARAPEDKQKIRMENELKIRQEIYQQEIQRQARHLQAVNYPLTFSEFLAPLAKHQQSLNVNSFSPSSRQMRFSKAYPQKNQYQYPDSMDRNNEKLGVLAGVSSIQKIEELQNRRDRILREFKELNTLASPPITGYQRQQKNPYDRSSPSLRPVPTIEPPYSKQKDALSRQRVQDFNRRYRNYLQNGQKSNPSPIKNHLQDSPIAQPYVASFIHSPPTRPTPAQQKDRKKYEYFFDK